MRSHTTMLLLTQLVVIAPSCAQALPDVGTGQGQSSSDSTGASGDSVAGTTGSTGMSSDGMELPDMGVDSSTGAPSPCGNGAIDEGEACDGEALPPEATCDARGFGEGVPGCLADCTMLDYSVCPGYDVCGDEQLGFGEECDGENLNSSTCDDFPNFTGGMLLCDERCRYDFSACEACLESGEECVPGRSLCCNLEDTCGGLITKECCQGASCPL